MIDVKILKISPVIKNEIQLYRNRMVILNYAQGNLFGIIIESSELFDMQTAIFRALWDTASRVHQPS